MNGFEWERLEWPLVREALYKCSPFTILPRDAQRQAASIGDRTRNLCSVELNHPREYTESTTECKIITLSNLRARK